MDKSRASSEYAAQLLSLPPATITDILLGTLDSTVMDCIDVLEQSMLASALTTEIPKEDLVKGIAQLRSRFVRKMEPISSKLDRYLLETVLKVPDHVLSPDDAAQRTKHTEKGHRKLLKEIESIKNDIQREKYTKAIFKGKLEEAEETLKNLKAVAAKIETTTTQVYKENNLTDIEENSTFIRKNFEVCKNRMNELMEIVPPPPENESKGVRCSVEQLPAFFKIN